jgi:3-methyladenine DNA glycosylase/8-oxoguanine DNA glycosylase
VSAPAAPPRAAHRRRPAQPLPQASGAYAVEVRVEVRPRWVFGLSPVNGMDGLHRVRGGVLHRLLHRDGSPVWLRIAQTAPDSVLFGARAADRELAEWGIERMRLSTGVDQDLAPFYERFRDDPLIGASEQLIEYERAAAIERRLVARLGRRCPESGLADCPTAAVIAAQAPALLASLDLSEGRAIALVRAAREVAGGRVDLFAAPHEPGWRRLRAIRGIGAWTVQCLALHGQQRLDQLPAGDLSYIKLVGRINHGHPWGRAEPAEVEAFFAPYAPWAGLAGAHALRSAGSAAAGRMAA